LLAYKTTSRVKDPDKLATGEIKLATGETVKR
jgi:hypothetical protein